MDEGSKNESFLFILMEGRFVDHENIRQNVPTFRLSLVKNNLPFETHTTTLEIKN